MCSSDLLCLCRPEDGDRLAAEILRHTATFGVRRVDCARYALAVDRNATPVETEWGPVRRKAGAGYGIEKSKPEYEDLAAAARAGDVPLEAARRAFREGTLTASTSSAAATAVCTPAGPTTCPGG